MASGDTKTESYLRAAAEGTRADLPSDTCCNTKTQNLILGVANRIMDVEDEVEELKNNPDVVDIVDTYADLQAYDTQHLTENDIIRVLQDETHSGNSTYYRFTKNPDTWTFIGEISGSSVNVVQTIGTSTTDVMSQDAATKLIYDTSNQNYENIKIGESSYNWGLRAVGIGKYVYPKGTGSIAIGSAGSATYQAKATGDESLAIGYHATASGSNSIALGAYSSAIRKGEINVETTGTRGFNSTPYRLISGVHDPVDAHDAATKGYVDANASAATFYMSVTPYANNSGVSLYSDIALTAAVPASTFVQALRDCKSVFLVYKSGDSDWSERRIAQIIGSHIPNADTAEAYDEVFPAGYYFDGSAGDVYMIQSATSDPDDTASFKIARRT